MFSQRSQLPWNKNISFFLCLHWRGLRHAPLMKQAIELTLWLRSVSQTFSLCCSVPETESLWTRIHRRFTLYPWLTQVYHSIKRDQNLFLRPYWIANTTLTTKKSLRTMDWSSMPNEQKLQPGSKAIYLSFSPERPMSLTPTPVWLLVSLNRE